MLIGFVMKIWNFVKKNTQKFRQSKHKIKILFELLKSEKQMKLSVITFT